MASSADLAMCEDAAAVNAHAASGLDCGPHGLAAAASSSVGSPENKERALATAVAVAAPPSQPLSTEDEAALAAEIKQAYAWRYASGAQRTFMWRVRALGHGTSRVRMQPCRSSIPLRSSLLSEVRRTLPPPRLPRCCVSSAAAPPQPPPQL